MARPRRLWTRLAVFALIGVLLGGVAALAVRERDDDAGQAAAASATVTAIVPTSGSATRSAAVTPGPSPESSAEPAAEPSAAGSKRTSLAAFVKHVSTAIKDGQALIEPLQQAAQAFDIKATKRAAADISDWAETERSWLDGHPPRACYAAVHAEYGSGVDDFGQAAKITKRFADAFPFADYDDLQRAVDLATSGSASMEDAGRLLQQVDC